MAHAVELLEPAEYSTMVNTWQEASSTTKLVSSLGVLVPDQKYFDSN